MGCNRRQLLIALVTIVGGCVQRYSIPSVVGPEVQVAAISVGSINVQNEVFTATGTRPGSTTPTTFQATGRQLGLATPFFAGYEFALGFKHRYFAIGGRIALDSYGPDGPIASSALASQIGPPTMDFTGFAGGELSGYLPQWRGLAVHGSVILGYHAGLNVPYTLFGGMDALGATCNPSTAPAGQMCAFPNASSPGFVHVETRVWAEYTWDPARVPTISAWVGASYVPAIAPSFGVAFTVRIPVHAWSR